MNVLLTHHVHGYPELWRRLAHAVHVADNSTRGGVPAQEGVVAFRPPAGSFGARVRYLRGYLQGNGIGLVYAQGLRELWQYWLACRKCRPRPRILLTARSSYTWRVGWKATAYLLLASRLSDGFVFLAGGPFRRWSGLCARLGLGCWHIPNPVDVSRFNVRGTASGPSSLGGGAGAGGARSSRSWRLGYVGVVHPMKGQRVLLEAMASLRGRGIQARVELVGDVLDSRYRRNLDQFVAQEGLESRVTFHGRMAYEGIPAFLSGLDVYVCPSLSEMMPFHVLEAMAAGLPVVGTRVWGVEDAVVDGETGHLCAPGSAEDLAGKLEGLFRSGRCKEMGQAGRRRAEECYDIPAVAEQYRRVVEELCPTG